MERDMEKVMETLEAESELLRQKIISDFVKCDDQTAFYLGLKNAITELEMDLPPAISLLTGVVIAAVEAKKRGATVNVKVIRLKKNRGIFDEHS